MLGHVTVEIIIKCDESEYISHLIYFNKWF
jgi:hypothetical protein